MSPTPSIYFNLEQRIADALKVAEAGWMDSAGSQRDQQRFDLIMDILKGRDAKEHHVLEALRCDGKLLDTCGLCGLWYSDERHVTVNP